MARMPLPKKTSEWQRLAERELERILNLAAQDRSLRRLGPRHPWSAGVSVLGRQAVKKLNKQYRNKDRVTDVLSFPAPTPIRLQGFLGDLAVCLPVLRAQAGEHGIAPDVELQVLLIHGVLHLLGLDHEGGESEARKMARFEKKLLQAQLKTKFVDGLIQRNR